MEHKSTTRINNTLKLQNKANRNIRTIEFRKNQIRKIVSWIKKNENKIKKSITHDLKKPEVEIDITEIWACTKEANYILKNLNKWTKVKKISKTIPLITTTSYIATEPKGIVLIIAPWNYPFQLSIMPLLAAIAAGNSVFLNPSEKTPATSKLINEMINELFSPSDVAVFEGDEKIVSLLLNEKFDHIFFTGGTKIGQIIMKKASKNLTPVTLELGGKCPAIIDKSANLKTSIDKIISTKFMNAGQTCIATDFILIEECVKKECIKLIKKIISERYGNPKLIKQNTDYGRIINKDHTKRLDLLIKKSLEHGSTIHQGNEISINDLYISPTIIETNFDDEIMKEEIFGPILPIITYKNFDSMIEKLNQMEYPLASYIFSKNKHHINTFIRKTKSGGVCINDASIHFLHHKLPFGGLGNSGIGSYHGKFGFLELSNSRPVIKNIDNSPIKFLYPPYNTKIKKLVKLIKNLI